MKAALSALFLAWGTGGFAAPGLAETWPTKAVTLVVPAPPGGNIDIAARLLGGKLQAIFGQPFVIENKPGAGGNIAAEYARTATGDDKLLFTANFLLFSPLIVNQPAYDWRKDFIPVSSLTFTPMVLEVHPGVAVKTVAELIDLARKTNGDIAMAAPGVGTSNHLISEMLQRKTGTKWITVQYRGNAPATADTVSGQTKFQFDQISSSLAQINSGALRPLAVTARTRVASLPHVPTLEEAGFPGLEAETFTGVFVAARTPPEVVTVLAKAIKEVAHDNDIVRRLDDLGARVEIMQTTAFQTYLDALYETWAPVIKEAGIQSN